MYADKCFINGKIYSMAKEGDFFEAMAVLNGKIVKVGSNEEIKSYDASEVFDLNGSIVLPGITDSHQHVLSYCEGLTSVNLSEVKSIDEMKKLLKEKAEQTAPGEWVKGVRFDHEKFPDKRFPTRFDLDEVSTEHPILAGRYCMHGYVANTKALKMAGIGKDFIPDAENTVEVDENGEPTGILWENAVSPILDILPDALATYESKKEAIKEVVADMSSCGITSIVPIQGKFCDAVEYIGIYQDLEKENALPVRAYIGFDEIPPFGMKTGFGNDKIKYGFYKIYSDGSMGSRAAAFFDSYSDAPGVKGVLNYTQEEMNNMVQTAYDSGLQIAIHAIGDKGLDVAVTAIEKAYYNNPNKDARVRLIHLLLVNHDLIERMKKLPIIIDIQPKFIARNLHWTEDRVGRERLKYAFSWKTLLNNGFMLTAGSDIPVDSYDPMLGIYAIVNRQDFDGYPEGGWLPEEKVTVYEALEMYTKNGAYASFEEDIKGTLEEGKYADFILLDRDPFEIDPRELKDIVVKETWLSGDRVFKR